MTATVAQTITRPNGMVPNVVSDFTPSDRRCVSFMLGNPDAMPTLCAGDTLRHDATGKTITVRFYIDATPHPWDDGWLYTEVAGRMFTAADVLEAIADRAFRFIHKMPRD